MKRVKRDISLQAVIVTVIIVLAATFVLLAINISVGQNFLTESLLIIIEITLLAMFASLRKIEYTVGGK